MARLAVKLPELLTVTGPGCPTAAPPTLIPGPKLASVVWFTQLVKLPVTVIVGVELGTPAFEVMEVITGWPASTVKLA